MKYVRLANGIVSEILPEEDLVFPRVPIEDRYSPEFLSACVKVLDNTVVLYGDIYNKETGQFTTPEPPKPPEPLPEEPVIPSTTYGEKIQFLEDCIAELATQIYS